VKENIHVWIDKWELQAGDSILEKIQSAIVDASVLLVMISKASVESEWCKKELNAGLVRELEEKRVVVIPVVLDNCEIPLFLREKYYVDFRKDFEQQFKILQDSLLRHTDISLNRVQNEKYKIDWAIDHGIKDNHLFICVDSVSFAVDQEYSVLCTINISGNEKATNLYHIAESKNDVFGFIDEVVKGFFRIEPIPDFRILLKDGRPVRNEIHVADPKLGYRFDASVYTRRMGVNNGFDLLFDFGSILTLMIEKREAITRKS
jgi:hypothetical protein